MSSRKMSERTWLSAQDPNILLCWLVIRPSKKHKKQRKFVTKRKMILLACACARMVWTKLTKKQRDIVSLVEKYADGLVPEDRILAAGVEAGMLVSKNLHASLAVIALAQMCTTSYYSNPNTPSYIRTSYIRTGWVGQVLCWCRCSNFPIVGVEPGDFTPTQANHIRCIFGNPFSREKTL